MKKQVLFLVIVMASVILGGCHKDKFSNYEEKAGDSLMSIKLENVKFAESEVEYRDVDCPRVRYVEKVCMIYKEPKEDSQIGSACEDGVGGKCKKKRSCTAIETIASSGGFSKEEIDYTIKLIEDEYGIRYFYE